MQNEHFFSQNRYNMDNLGMNGCYMEIKWCGNGMKKWDNL